MRRRGASGVEGRRPGIDGERGTEEQGRWVAVRVWLRTWSRRGRGGCAGDRRMRRDARLTRRHGRRKRARGTGGSERWLYVRSPIVYEVITTGKAGRDRLVHVKAVPNDVEGPAMVSVAGHPSAGACVHRVCGQVFSFRPDVFTFRPNVSTLRPDVSTFPADFPKCVHSARACVNPVP